MRSLTLLGLVVLAGCQEYLFAPVCPQSVEETQLVATPVTPKPVDILFVVDNSGSMADEQERLATNFDAFLDQLSAAPFADYRIAVVSTDLITADGEQGGLQFPSWNAQAPYNYQSTNDDGCQPVGIPHGCFRGPTASERIISSTMDRTQQLAAFRSNIKLGSCGIGVEQGLAASVQALELTGPNECNNGFLRNDANLVLIFVSDEEDQSDGLVSAYAPQLATIGWERIRAAAIVGSFGGAAGNCRTAGGISSNECGAFCEECPGPQAYCDALAVDPYYQNGGCAFCSLFNAPGCCSALAGNRYESFLELVDNNVRAADPGVRTATLIDSICQDDFSATLQTIARELVVTPCFDLNPTPVHPDGIGARVAGGRELTKGTDFRVATKRGQSDVYELCLEGDVLGPNEQLEIFFVTDVESRPSKHPACSDS